MRPADELARARRYVSQKPGLSPLQVGLTGSHYYGFPSPDSDLDLKGIHVAPLTEILSLDPPGETIEETAEFEGQEVDFTSHEIALALRLLLRGNGNILERILTPYQAIESSVQQELALITIRSLSRRFYHHYRGFFAQKCRDHEKAPEKTVKDLLYVYRSALTGIHLLTTGELIGNVTRLAPLYGFPHVLGLVEVKIAGTEKAPLEAAADRYAEDREKLEAMLTSACERSPLPEEPPNRVDVGRFLVDVRLSRAPR